MESLSMRKLLVIYNSKRDYMALQRPLTLFPSLDYNLVSRSQSTPYNPTIPVARRPALPLTPSSTVPLAAIHCGVVVPEECSVEGLGVDWNFEGSFILSSVSGATSPAGQVSGSRIHPACKILIYQQCMQGESKHVRPKHDCIPRGSWAAVV
jgi:hypothetical protein